MPNRLDASSIYSNEHSPDEALSGDGYFCSKKNVVPVHWWMEFQEPTVIGTIHLKEVHSGCTYDFWGCNGTIHNWNNKIGCTGKKVILMSGTRKKLMETPSLYNALFNVYGLTAKKLGSRKYMAISNFYFNSYGNLNI